MTTIMQGDSYPIYIDLLQDGSPLKPHMIDDLAVYVGESLSKTYSGGGVAFEHTTSRWYIRPTQAESFALEEGVYDVIVRVKYKNQPESDVKGEEIDRLRVRAFRGGTQEVL